MDHEETKRLFGLRLRTLRRERGLSQEELAAAIDRTVETVGKIERGKWSPRVETAQTIADALGVPLFSLFEFERREITPQQHMIRQLSDLLERQDNDVVKAVTQVAEMMVKLRSHSPI